jgi:hypothetical protein
MTMRDAHHQRDGAPAARLSHALLRATTGFALSATLLVILMVGLAAL